MLPEDRNFIAPSEYIPSKRATWRNEIIHSPALFVIFLIGIAAVAGGFTQEFIRYSQDNPAAVDVIERIQLDGERNLLAWLSSSTMILIAWLLYSRGRLRDRRAEGQAMSWMLAGAVFMLLSADESLALHEQTGNMLRAKLGLSGLFHFGWLAIALVLVPVGIVLFRKFIIQVNRETKGAALVALVIYLAGAFGIEMFTGYLISGSGLKMETVEYQTLVAIEEGLEFVGLWIFLMALLMSYPVVKTSD